MAGTLTRAEEKRLELILTIQSLYNGGESVHEIARITGKDWKTVKKYLDGDPKLLCKSRKRSPLDIYTGFIINSIKDGQNAMAIAKQLKAKGNNTTLTNIRIFVRNLAKEYGLEIVKYRRASSKNGREEPPFQRWTILHGKEYSIIFG